MEIGRISNILINESTARKTLRACAIQVHPKFEFTQTKYIKIFTAVIVWILYERAFGLGKKMSEKDKYFENDTFDQFLKTHWGRFVLTTCMHNFKMSQESKKNKKQKQQTKRVTEYIQNIHP